MIISWDRRQVLDLSTLTFSWSTHRWSWVAMILTLLFLDWRLASQVVWLVVGRRSLCYGALCISWTSCSVTLPFLLAFRASFRGYVFRCVTRCTREGIRIFRVVLIVINISFWVQYTFLRSSWVPRKVSRWVFLYLQDSVDFKRALKARSFLHFS